MIELTRKPDWESLFYPAIEKAMHTPFKWGEHDCALFAAELIETMTGTDLAADFRGQYSTLKGSLKTIKTAGFTDIEALVNGLLEPVEILQAKRGYLVLIEIESKQFLGIATGTTAVSPGKKGLMVIPMKHWIKAWKV